MGNSRGDLLQFGAEFVAFALDLVEEAGRQQDVEHRVARRAGQRIAAIGRAVRAGHQRLGETFLGQNGAERESAADAFRRRHDIRRDAGPFMREQLAGAAHAGLHLIHAEDDVVLVAHRAQVAQELRIGRAHAAFALDRLDDDAAGAGPDLVAHRVHVAERNVIEPFHHRTEAVQIVFVAGGGERGQRAAMERALEADEPEAFRLAGVEHGAAHHLDHALVRLGARVAEEHAVGERRVDQPLRQTFRLRNAIQVGGVHHLGGLLGDRLDQMRMAVAQRGRGDARPEIQKSSPVDRPQPGAFAPLKGEVGTSVVR